MSPHNNIINQCSHSRTTRLIRRVTAFLPSSIGQCFLPGKRGQRKGKHQVTVTIDILPDEVLLEIFASYVARCDHVANVHEETWEPLVRVCQRWRSITFASPHRLDLQIRCTGRTRVKEILDVWPTLPILVLDMQLADWWQPQREVESANSIIAALEHRDRIYEIELFDFSSSLIERFAAAMQEPIPALNALFLCPWGLFPFSDDVLDSRREKPAAAFLEEFLGGSAPNLRRCVLSNIAFPGIWNLLLTCHHLVELVLHSIPHPDYLSPEAMATHLSAMPNLDYLDIGFRSPQSRPDWSDPPNRPPPPLTRVALPTLTSFRFHGVSEYAEDLVSRIYVPLLDHVSITFFNQLIFDIPRLHDFLSRVELLRFYRGDATVSFMPGVIRIHDDLYPPHLNLSVLCVGLDWQLSAIAQLCNSPFPPFSELEHLQITDNRPGEQVQWLDDMEESQWLELLHPFSSLRTLTLYGVFVPHVALALQGLTGESVIKVLPALQELSVSRQHLVHSEEAIMRFSAARALSGHPIVVDWLE